MKRNRFNQREVARALRAVRAAGEVPKGFEIDPTTGRITVIITQPSDAPATSEPNEWDEVFDRR